MHTNYLQLSSNSEKVLLASQVDADSVVQSISYNSTYSTPITQCELWPPSGKN